MSAATKDLRSSIVPERKCSLESCLGWRKCDCLEDWRSALRVRGKFGEGSCSSYRNPGTGTETASSGKQMHVDASPPPNRKLDKKEGSGRSAASGVYDRSPYIIADLNTRIIIVQLKSSSFLIWRLLCGKVWVIKVVLQHGILPGAGNQSTS